MKTFKNLMIELFNEQKNALKWATLLLFGIFALASLSTVMQLPQWFTFQQLCYGGLPLMSIVILPIFALYQGQKSCEPFTQNKYRALPVSATQLYGASMLVSFLIFLSVTIILSVVSYLGLLQNTAFVSSIGAQSQLTFYFKTFLPIIFTVTIVFLTLIFGFNAFNLLIVWMSSYLPKSWQFTSQLVLATAIILPLSLLSGTIHSSNTGAIAFNLNSDYSSFTFHANKFMIYLSLKLFIFGSIYILALTILSIIILDKFVETDEKMVLFGKIR